MIDIAAKKQERARIRAAVRARKGPPASDKFRMYIPAPDDLLNDERDEFERHLVREARHATFPYILHNIRIEWTTVGAIGDTQLPAGQVICLLRGDIR